MLAALLQAVGHRYPEAGLVTTEAYINATLHLRRNLMHSRLQLSFLTERLLGEC